MLVEQKYQKILSSPLVFEDKKTRWLMDILGAFAVNREKMEVSTLKTVKEVFKSFYHLAIFPQGRIQKTHKIEKINKGFAYTGTLKILKMILGYDYLWNKIRILFHKWI